MAPDRTQSQNMSKREDKSFKEYAQRWRDLAIQVASPMVEREMITMIVDILLVFYYEKLVGYMLSSFVDLVFTGERLEVGLKKGKFDYVSTAGTSNKNSIVVKKEEKCISKKGSACKLMKVMIIIIVVILMRIITIILVIRIILVIVIIKAKYVGMIIITVIR